MAGNDRHYAFLAGWGFFCLSECYFIALMTKYPLVLGDDRNNLHSNKQNREKEIWLCIFYRW